MNCLDTNALIDYLHGNEEIGAFLDDHAQLPIFAPTIVLHEVFVGAARVRGREGVGAVREDLDWLEPLKLTVDAAAEAAVINTELSESGTPIGTVDTLIAGIVRECGARLVTADSDFDAVDGLSVHYYR